MRIPNYLLLDLLGKLLILCSVGAQLLVLGPASDQRSANRISQIANTVMMVHDDDSLSRIQESLKAAVKRNSEAPLGNGPLSEQAKRFAYESEDRQRKLQRSFQELASMQKEIDALEPQIKSSRQIVIATFILGTLLTILGTYLEKRNKPAP